MMRKAKKDIFSLLFPQQQITADKRLRYALPKLPLATSFIRKPLGDIFVGD
jgi:hypothetical protein